MKGRIHSIETFGTLDGPGIRFVLFLQGCPLRCQYCHNPDTWEGQGEEYSAEEIVEKVLRYKNYFKGGGGVTVSGGEPLLQPDFVCELMTLLKKEGLHTAVDTSGFCFDPNDENSVAAHERLVKVCDLVLLDVKHIDSDKHKKITGQGNEHTLAFAKFLSDRGVPVWIRHVLVPELTDEDGALKRLKAFIDGLQTVEKVEVLPYHTLGVHKYEKLGLSYSLQGVEPPEQSRIENARRILEIKK